MRYLSLLLLLLVGCLPFENDATRMVPKQASEDIDVAGPSAAFTEAASHAIEPEVGPSGVLDEEVTAEMDAGAK